MLMTFRSKVAACYVLVGLIVGLVGLSLYGSVHEFINRAHWVNHTHQVLQVLDATIFHVKDVESEQRGYIITGNPAFLSSYREALQSLNKELTHLKQLTRDNPLQQAEIHKFETLIQKRVLLSRQAISTYQQKGFYAVQKKTIL